MTNLQDTLENIGFKTPEMQQHVIAALIVRGIFSDSPQLSKKFEDNYRGIIDTLRNRFKTISDNKNVNDAGYEELLSWANLLLNDKVADIVLNNQLKTSKFLLGLTQDYTLKPGGTMGTTQSTFNDKFFTPDIAFTDAQKKIFSFISKDASKLQDIKTDEKIMNFAIFGTAGENLKIRLDEFIKFCHNTKDKVNLFYTCNTRYLLKPSEIDFSTKVISSWIMQDLKLQSDDQQEKIKSEIENAIRSVLVKEHDFTRSNKYDEMPSKILTSINEVLAKYKIQSLTIWPGDKYAILSRNKELFKAYNEREILQNEVRKEQNFLLNEKQGEDEKSAKKESNINISSTPNMPTPFDYIELQISENKLQQQTSFIPQTLPLTKFVDKKTNMPDMRLASTFDELKSYHVREINSLIMISDSDQIIQQKANASTFSNVKEVCYVSLPNFNFPNFMQSLSKSCYQPLTQAINNLEKQLG